MSEGDVRCLAEDRPDRIGDVSRLKAGSCHLVEQGQKGVEVVRVDDRHVDRSTGELFRRLQAREATPDDEHRGPTVLRDLH